MIVHLTRKKAESILETTSIPNLEIEISESKYSLEEIIEAVRTVYGEQWKFWGTEKRYESCLMAIFEMEN